MKVESAPASIKADERPRVPPLTAAENYLSSLVWAVVALFNLATQIVFRRDLQPGEFGTLNTALGVIGLLTVPALAVHRAFPNYLDRPHSPEENPRLESLPAAALLVTESFAWVWGALCLVLIFPLLALLHLPRFPLQLFTLINVLVALGGVVGYAACAQQRQFRFWAVLVFLAGLTRLLAGAGLAAQEPWAESGLAAVLAAGFVAVTPMLRAKETDFATRRQACRVVLDRDFLLAASTTLSVLLGLFLFSNADRIVAQSWFGGVTDNNFGLVNWSQFDAYQTAGLIARALLWGTQPLLWMFFARRIRLSRTCPAALGFFWIYLGVLLLGAIMVGSFARPLSRLFCGDDFPSTARLVPSLAAAMIPLGLLQAVGIFALASRRHPECFVFGGCSLGYTLMLYLAGRQPELMPVFMFGGGLVALMVVLFVGVVRWGRMQP